MKAKIISIVIVCAIIALVLFSVLSAKVVLGIFAAVAFFALIGVMLRMGYNAWIELEKKDPEQAKKLCIDAMAEFEARRALFLPGF